MLAKHDLWMSRLAEYVERKRHEPFDYASNDCAKFVAGAVEAMTGERPGVEYLSKYSTMKGSEDLIKRNGLREMCEAIGGPMRTDILFAQLGDVLLLRHDGRLVLALCMGRHAALPGADGLVYPTLDQAVGYWRV